MTGRGDSQGYGRSHTIRFAERPTRCCAVEQQPPLNTSPTLTRKSNNSTPAQYIATPIRAQSKCRATAAAAGTGSGRDSGTSSVAREINGESARITTRGTFGDSSVRAGIAREPASNAVQAVRRMNASFTHPQQSRSAQDQDRRTQYPVGQNQDSHAFRSLRDAICAARSCSCSLGPATGYQPFQPVILR